MTTIIPIVSGGLDSVTLLYHLIDNEANVPLVVSFNYGQRHKKELGFAAYHAKHLHAEHVVIDLYKSGLTKILATSTSSLTNPSLDVPEGHYAEENMKATVVPNRNMIMLAIAGGIAVAREADGIAAAVHAGDHFIYPDCRPDFMRSLNAAMVRGNQGFGRVPLQSADSWPSEFIWTPFIHLTKAEIAERAIRLGIKMSTTWSCYKGGEVHCGRCGTCVERIEAINAAFDQTYAYGPDQPIHVGIDDTVYADTEYWRAALAKGH